MRFRAHWSDARSQLGQPIRVRVDDRLKAPFVYFIARTMAEAKAKVKAFNDVWGPPNTGMNMAHMPFELFSQHGMKVYL